MLVGAAEAAGDVLGRSDPGGHAHPVYGRRHERAEVRARRPVSAVVLAKGAAGQASCLDRPSMAPQQLSRGAHGAQSREQMPAWRSSLLCIALPPVEHTSGAKFPYGRRYVQGLMTDAGLRVRSDGMGNIFGRWEGSLPAERAHRTHKPCCISTTTEFPCPP